jgi:hypothetical protein
MASKIDNSASPDALFAFDDIPTETKLPPPLPNTASTIQPYQPNIDRSASPDVLFQLDGIPVEPKRPAPPPNTTSTIPPHQPKIKLQIKRTTGSSPPKDIHIKQDSPKAQ